MPYIALDPLTAQAAPTTTLGAPLTSVGETLASFKAELVQLMAQRADVIKDTTRQAKWINRGYQHLCGMLTIPELKGSILFPVVASQPLYLLPVDPTGKYQVVERIMQPLSLVDDTDYRGGGRQIIGPISLSHFYGLANCTGLPTRFLRYNSMLVLWPTPESVLSLILNFQINPLPLAADTDSPLIPQKWHEGIVLAARWRALRDLKVWNEAAIAKNDMLDVIRPLEDREAEEQASAPSTMRPVRSAHQFYRRHS